MADYDIDVFPSASELRSRALEESRRRRLEASQKRRAEWERRNEEKERVRRVKEEWERENQSQAVANGASGDHVDSDGEGGSESSPDLMESPPPVKSTKAAGRLKSSDSDSEDDRRGFGTVRKSMNSVKDKSTTKRSNRRSKLSNIDSDDSDDGDHNCAARKENASILRGGRYTSDSPRKWQRDAGSPKKSESYRTNNHAVDREDYAAALSRKSPKKKPWQMDSSDESEVVDFESLRQKRLQKQSSNQTQQTNQYTRDSLSNTKPSVKFSPKLPKNKKKHKYAESSSSSEDEAALEEAFKKRFEQKQRAKAAAAAATGNNQRYSSSSGDTGIPNKFRDDTNNISSSNRYSSSSGESIPKKFEEQLKTTERNRYSSSSGDSVPKRFQEQIVENNKAPSKQVKRSRLTQHHDSSSEDEAELENLFRKSMEEKRLKSYKRNPLSQAKKEDDDWKSRIMEDGPRLHVTGEGLVGKEIVLAEDQVKEVKDNVSDLGVSQDGPSRRMRRGQISSPDSPALKKKPVQDDLWDDWDDDDAEKAKDTDSDDMPKKRGRKAAAKSKEDDWTDSKKKQRSRPKKVVDDSTSPQPVRKRPSPSKNNNDAPTARKRTVRGRRPEPKSDSEASASDGEEEHAKAQLKPNFANPLFEPGPLEPFLLSRGEEDKKPLAQELENGVVKHQVPASMNRYLRDYQRAGIQFMYSSVIEGKGCVLGDDMGLGKTVQVISLIAALQQKTGTGLDRVMIQRLRRDVSKAIKIATQARLDKNLGVHTDVDPDAVFDHIQRPAFAPILIIVPTSVIQNWANEFETWGHFNVSVYAGSNREKAIEDIVSGTNFILIVGKSLITREADFVNLLRAEWRLIFVDEYHEFKNEKSQSYKNLEQLRDDIQCPIVGMTGTLMQNNHMELFNLIDLVRPGLLEDRMTFKEYTSKPIMLARAKDAKDDIKRIAKQREEELMRTISPAFVERKKEVVLKDSLTRKNEKVIFCELSELQKRLYRHLLSLPDYEMLRMGNAPCGACNVNQQYFMGYKRMKTRKEQLSYQRRHKEELVARKKCCFRFPFEGLFVGDDQEPGDTIDRNAILWIQKHKKILEDPNALPEGVEVVEELEDGYALVSCKSCPNCISLSAMSKLHKVCSHPSLLQVDRTAPSGTETDKKIEFAKIAFRDDILNELPGQSIYRSDGIMDDHLKLSGKMRTLDYCLRRYIRKRDRILVFSYSTATLDLIQQHVKIQGWSHLRLDGQTPTSARQSLVDKFQKDETISLFLISTRAGGLGLNLTAANKVIIFDVNWNPSYDEQAQDRSYRIGQENDVEVIRLVARGTIEEQMYARQVYKVQLKKQTLGGNVDGKALPSIFKGVDKDDKRKGELFGLENLLMYRDGSFMQLLWKKADNPNEAHDVNEISRYTADDMDKAMEEAEAEKDSDNSDSEYEEVANKVKASGINHEDLFNAERGKARYAQGDDGFEEEMGGQSQMIHVATKLACENFESDTCGEETGDEEDTKQKKAKVKQVLHPVAEEMDDKPSPVKSFAGQPSLGGKVKSEQSRIENASSISAEASLPVTQPPDSSNEKTGPKSRNKVSIMGVVFEESKKVAEKRTKKSGLYIPSYPKSKK